MKYLWRGNRGPNFEADMWRITGRDREGGRREVPFRETRASRANIREAMLNLMGEQTPRPFLRELDARDPLPGVDGIEYWGGAAAESMQLPSFSADRIQLDIGEPVAALTRSEGDRRETWFHDPDALVADVSDLREIEIAHYPDTPRPPIASAVMESRLYAERLVSEDDRLMSPFQPSVQLALPEGGQEPRGFVARVAYGLGSLVGRPIEEPTDPFRAGRLRYYERQHSVVAQRCPDIALAAAADGSLRLPEAAPAGQPVLIFVHGTFSCALPSLAALFPLHIRTFRFEHDTFLQPTANSKDLVEAITAYARQASTILPCGSLARRTGRPPRRDPLAEREVPNRGPDLWHTSSRHSHGQRRDETLQHDAGQRPNGRQRRFLMGPRIGRRQVVPDDEVVREPSLWHSRHATQRSLHRVAGSSCILALVGGGLSHERTGRLRYLRNHFTQGVFQGTPNDLVVSTESALASGAPQATLGCSHFE